MAIGTPSTQQQLNLLAGQYIISARNALQNIIYFSLYLQTLGQAGIAALGFDPDDAAALLSVYADLAAVADMCNGAPYVGPDLPFNFLQSTAPLWGGN